MSRNDDTPPSIDRYRICSEDGSAEYIFPTKDDAQRFVDFWVDKVSLDEGIYHNDDETFSVRVYSRG